MNIYVHFPFSNFYHCHAAYILLINLKCRCKKCKKIAPNGWLLVLLLHLDNCVTKKQMKTFEFLFLLCYKIIKMSATSFKQKILKKGWKRWKNSNSLEQLAYMWGYK